MSGRRARAERRRQGPTELERELVRIITGRAAEGMGKRKAEAVMSDSVQDELLEVLTQHDVGDPEGLLRSVEGVESPIEALFAIHLSMAVERGSDVVARMGEEAARRYACAGMELRVRGVDVAEPQQTVEADGHRYRPDFLMRSLADILNPECVRRPVGRVVAVECDGKRYHSTPEQRERDANRDEALLRCAGVHVLRLTGREIVRDPAGCVRRALTETMRLPDPRGVLDDLGYVPVDLGDEGILLLDVSNREDEGEPLQIDEFFARFAGARDKGLWRRGDQPSASYPGTCL